MARARFVAPGLVLGALVTVLPTGPINGQEPPSRLATLHERFVSLIQGSGTPVSGSPALCAALGKPTPFHDPHDAKAWLTSQGACELEYASDPTAIVTRATSGLDGWLLGDPSLAVSLGETVRALRDEIEAQAIEDQGIDDQSRLTIHSTAWELGVGLATAGARAPWNELSCDVLGLVRATAFPPETIKRLSSNLATVLATGLVTDDPDASLELAAEIARIVAGEEVLEVHPPSGAHGETLLGRFTARIFISAGSASERARLRTYLTRRPRFRHLGALPMRFEGVRATLVLYWNVLSPTLDVVPTEQVAFVQHYGFGGRSRIGITWADAAELITFTSVRYRRQPGDGPADYVIVGGDHMSRTSFLDAMPDRPGVGVTTLQAQCLSCHRQVVETFHWEFERPLSFSRPLSEPPVELPYIQGVAEPALRAWAARCGDRES